MACLVFRLSEQSLGMKRRPLRRPRRGAGIGFLRRSRIIAETHEPPSLFGLVGGLKRAAIPRVSRAPPTATPGRLRRSAKRAEMRRRLGSSRAASRRGRAAWMRLQGARGGGGVLGELVGGTDRPADQLAAAVGATPLEDRVCAAPAECALVSADHRLGRLRRQIAIAALAVRAELQHRSPQVSSMRRRSSISSAMPRSPARSSSILRTACMTVV